MKGSQEDKAIFDALTSMRNKEEFPRFVDKKVLHFPSDLPVVPTFRKANQSHSLFVLYPRETKRLAKAEGRVHRAKLTITDFDKDDWNLDLPSP